MGYRSSSPITPVAWFFVLLKLLLLALLLASCAYNPYYDPSKPHHTPDGFRNNYTYAERKVSLSWRWEQFWRNRSLAAANDPPPEILMPDEDFLRTNRVEPTLTWIGHSTVLLQLGGMNVLIDPFFSKRASPVSFAGLRRKTPPALRLDRLPHIDVVLISHDHYDHLMEAMHMNPTDAVQVHQDLHARYSMGIHWGAFEMADERLEEPPRALANALAASGISSQQFFVMKHGETRRLSPLLH